MLFRAVTAVAMFLSATVSAPAQMWQGGGGFHSGGGAGFHSGGFNGGGAFHRGAPIHSGAMAGRPTAGMIGSSPIWRGAGTTLAGRGVATTGGVHGDMDHKRRSGNSNPLWHYGGWGAGAFAGALLVAPYSYDDSYDYSADGSNNGCVTYQPVYDQWGYYLGQQPTNQCDPGTLSGDPPRSPQD